MNLTQCGQLTRVKYSSTWDGAAALSVPRGALYTFVREPTAHYLSAFAHTKTHHMPNLTLAHYVDGLTPTQLQERYRAECGVYAHRGNLIRWLKVISEERISGEYIK